MKRLNYLLGFGERYVQPIPPPQGGGPKKQPYTAAEAKLRLGSQVERAVQVIDTLPALACPNDEGVMAVTLHPSFLAKSHYPDDFFALARVTPIGSRQKEVKPEKWGVQRHPVGKTKSVQPNRYLTEQELRTDWHKWETVWSQETTVRGSNLKNPVIDIHYMVRERGAGAKSAPNIPYALVVSLRKKGMHDLYNQVLQRFRNLQQLRPTIEIPIQT